MRVFVLRCPQCKNSMRYMPAKGTLLSQIGSRKKRCVYCGRTFGVRQCVVRTER